MLRVGQFAPQLKLLYHTDRIQEWLRGNNIYPIIVEFDLSNACNHKCDFCTFHYINDKSILDKDVALRTIDILADKGVKAINWTGGGEPLVNKSFKEIANHAYSRGIKQGLFTNGALLDDDTIEVIINTHDWVRISIDAASKDTYESIHGVDDFDKVTKNVRNLVEAKNGLPIEVGIGFVITPHNHHEIYLFSDLIDETRVDYGQYKPGINDYMASWQYEGIWWREIVLPKLNRVFKKNNKAVINDYKFKELLNEDMKRQYDKCYGHEFCPCIGATGDVWLCTHMRDIEGYSFGNIHEESFSDIWEGSRRQDIIKSINFDKCQFCCKNHEINKALYAIKHPEARHHGDFL